MLKLSFKELTFSFISDVLKLSFREPTFSFISDVLKLSFRESTLSRNSALAKAACTLPSPIFCAVSIVVSPSFSLTLSLTIRRSPLSLSSCPSFLLNPRITATVTTKSTKYTTYNITRMVHPSTLLSCPVISLSIYFWKIRTTNKIANPQINENSKHIYPRKLNGCLE